MPIDTQDPVHARIKGLIDTHDVVLFMKGTPQMPQCGFSAGAVGELEALGVSFSDPKVTTVDVLSDPDVRMGIKAYSDWPTIPQLYVRQEFVGGSDIVREAAASGELHQMLGIPFTPAAPPTITVTDALITAVASSGDEGPELMRLVVGPGFRYQIGFDTPNADDFVVESNGLKVLVDKASARRADGITLDFQPGTGGGVLIDNPNEPPKVKQLDVNALKQLIDGDRSFRLFDVRSDAERDIAVLHASAEPLTTEKVQEITDLDDKDTMLVFHCHHGGRSQQAADHFLRLGFRRVFNVQGGIEAWSTQIDPTVPRY